MVPLIVRVLRLDDALWHQDAPAIAVYEHLAEGSAASCSHTDLTGC